MLTVSRFDSNFMGTLSKNLDEMDMDELKKYQAEQLEMIEKKTQQFIGGVENLIDDAINKRRIFHSNEKEISRINAYTQTLA